MNTPDISDWAFLCGGGGRHHVYGQMFSPVQFSINFDVISPNLASMRIKTSIAIIKYTVRDKCLHLLKTLTEEFLCRLGQN